MCYRGALTHGLSIDRKMYGNAEKTKYTNKKPHRRLKNSVVRLHKSYTGVFLCLLSLSKLLFFATQTRSPVVKICGVRGLGPEAFQQGPRRAIWQRFRLLRREDESDGPASKANIAMWPIARVLHQPFDIYHGEVMDM